MKKQKILSLLGLMVLLCCGYFAGAQSPIPLTGPTTVCEGTKHSYTYPVTPNIYYQWSINTRGYISSVTGNIGLVYWGSTGVGVLNVYGIDAIGDTVEIGTTNVTILAKPQPVITTDTRVACQPLVPPPVDLDPFNPPIPPTFIDTGCQKVCENSTVTYTANGNPTSTYTWTVLGGSATPSGNTCVVVWGPRGPGKVTVTETTVNGCEGTKSICIDIIEAPIADFFAFPDSNATTINVCDSSEVIFIDRSVASPGSPIVAWHWDFGDGSYSNAQGSRQMPLSHTYVGAGLYTATLTVTNACGCKSTYSININVDPQKALKIECPAVVCEGDVATYSINSTCTSTTNWSVIGGTISFPTATTVTVTWNNPDANGFGYVFYDGQGCPGTCPAIFVAKVPIVMMTGVIQGPDTICPDKQYIYRLPQWPSTKFNWSEPTGLGTIIAGDQPNEFVITVPDANAGNTITIDCSYMNTIFGCTGNATKNVYVQTRPKLDGPDVVCLNTNGNYTLTGPNASSAMWTLTYPDASTANFGPASSISPLFDQVGPYLLSIEGDFCPPNIKEITVNAPPPPPDTIIGPDTICKGAPFKYEAGNELPGHIFNWWVDNGDANAASGNESFIKLNTNSTGPFVIHLWRESTMSPHCHSDTITKTIDTPVVIFNVAGPDTVCPSSYQNYSVNYTDGETYDWIIDDQLYGSVMQGQGTPNIQVLWNNSTGVTADLICRIRKCFNNYYYDTFKVYILPAPIAVITGPSTVCNGAPFTMSVTGNGTGVAWDMGDGTTVAGGDVLNYQYNLNNTSNVTMKIVATVYNPNGCPDTIKATKTVTVQPGPVVSIASNGPSLHYCDSTVSQTLFTTPLSASPSIASYKWYRNNTLVGTSSTLFTTQFGTYHVEVTGTNGCVYKSFPYVIYYECNDTCDLTIDPTVTIDSVNLDSCGFYHIVASHSATGFISHSWHTGGTIVSSNVNEAYIRFSSAETTQSVTYKAKYTDGTDTCTYEARATINIPYIAGIGVTQLCTGTGGRDVLLTFKGTQKGAITSYTYKVDGSVVYSGSNSSFTVTLSAGSHYFEIIVGDGTSPTCWAATTVVIAPLPVANFNYWRDTACAEQSAVEFTNTSTPTNGYTSFWDFGDISTNYQQHPERVYLTGGLPLKSVVLTITDANGCTDDTTRDLFIIPRRLQGRISPTPPFPCKGDPVFLDYLPDGSFPSYPDTFYWMNDDINFATGTYRPMTVFESGYYWVRGTDHYGCFWNTEADTVNVIEVPPAFVYGDTNQCINDMFVLSGYAGSDPDIQYEWLLNGFPIGKTTALIQEMHTVPGVYTYRVIVTIPNPGGGFCSDTSDPFRVRVRALPSAPWPGYNIVDCNDYTVFLDVTASLPYGVYNWSTGQSGTPIYVKTGGNFQVTYTDTFGCEIDTSIAIPKDPRVYLWIFPTGCFSVCLPNTITITGPIWPLFYWDYLYNGGSNFFGSGVPVDYVTNTAGRYNLLINNGWCTVTSSDMYLDNSCGTKPGRPEGVRSVEQNKAGMELIPNPANDKVTIKYQFSATGQNKWLEVYDVTGRLVSTHGATKTEGAWELNLDRFTPGIYNIVMREDGRAVLYGKLSVVK